MHINANVLNTAAAAAAAAKSLQSCPTLFDPIDGSPPGSHPWDSPGKYTGVGSHFLLQYRHCCCCCCQVASVVSDSVRPHRQQPTRPHPWDSPGKNAGVGCHFLLQCMKVKSESEVPQSCLTLSDPMDCSPPGPPSMGFSRQEYWSGVPLPSPVYPQMSSNSCILYFL